MPTLAGIVASLVSSAIAGAVVLVIRRRAAESRALAAGVVASSDGKTITQTARVSATRVANAHLLYQAPVGGGTTVTRERAAAWPPASLTGTCAPAPIEVGGAVVGRRRESCGFEKGVFVGPGFLAVK